MRGTDFWIRILFITEKQVSPENATIDGVDPEFMMCTISVDPFGRLQAIMVFVVPMSIPKTGREFIHSYSLDSQSTQRNSLQTSIGVTSLNVGTNRPNANFVRLVINERDGFER